MTAYHAVYIDLKEQAEADLLIGLLNDFECEGFEEKEKLLIAYLPAFPPASIPELKAALTGFTFHIEKIPDQNWNALWEANFQPVVVNDFCGVRANFHPPFQGVQHEIVINPRMSFGTGHHATTRMMIQMMETIDLKYKKVLDFGTGTGILSILASQMGARKVIAIDNDANAIENAAQNMEGNKTSGVHLYYRGNPDIEEEGGFDCILANINKNVILDSYKSLVEQLREKSFILISGFLKEDRKEMREVLEKNRPARIKEFQDGNWMAFKVTF